MINTPERYTSNPFITDMTLDFSVRQVKFDTSNETNILVNEDTGESKNIDYVTYKKVDKEPFIKLFVNNSAFFNLKVVGHKVFYIVVYLLQKRTINKDIITIDKYTVNDYLEEYDVTLPRSSLIKGINDLIEANIIARAEKIGDYYINPAVIFNGNRSVLFHNKK
jgi:hypothetical protein